MTVGFQPADDNVLVRLVTADDLIEDSAAEWADVLAVGPGRRTSDGVFVAPDLNPGDRIALRPNRAVHLRIQDEILAIVGGSDILGVLLSAGVTRRSKPGATAAEPAVQDLPPHARPSGGVDESLEGYTAPDALDQEASTAEDLH